MDLYDCQQQLVAMLDPNKTDRLPGAHHCIQQFGTLSPEKRLDIYRHSITAAQQRTLHLIFPVCNAILGEACFDTLARDYAWDSRSDCIDLNHYGHRFAEFLDDITQNRQAFADYGYLGDLCRLEWLWHHCHFATDTPDQTTPVSISLPDLDKDSTRFGTIPALFLFETPWPVYEIWLAHHMEKDIQPEMPYSLQKLVVWRQNDLVKIAKLDAPADLILAKLENRCTLSQLEQDSFMDNRSLHQYLLYMNEQGWIMPVPEYNPVQAG